MPPGFRLPPAARHQPPCWAASRWHGSLEAPKRLLSWPPWVLILLLSAITFFFTLTVSTLPTVNIQKRTNVFHLCLFNRTCVRIITFWILPLGQVHVLCYITEHKTNYILRFTHFVCCSHRGFFFYLFFSIKYYHFQEFFLKYTAVRDTTAHVPSCSMP